LLYNLVNYTYQNLDPVTPCQHGQCYRKATPLLPELKLNQKSWKIFVAQMKILLPIKDLSNKIL
jgi:hypothetical protein